MSNSWSVIVHGGCKPIKPDEEAANRKGCAAAALAARQVLEADGSALDAVEAAVRVLETDPTFNAGAGGARNEKGDLETDASLMDGDTLDIGAVAAAPGLINPIHIARILLRDKPTLLAGAAAGDFARATGAAQFEKAPARQREMAATDTVGCVARDKSGRIASAVSTGGLKGAKAGRVGDTSLPGCGFYADSAVGGVSISGDGEAICRNILAARIIDHVEGGTDIDSAISAVLRRMERTGGAAGVIGLDRNGRFGWDHHGDQFAVAWANQAGPEPRTAISRKEKP